MAKIINFPNLSNTIEGFLQETAEILKENHIECLLIAGKTKEGEVLTGYFNCGFGVRQELCGHIQCDIIDQMIRNNSERY